MWQAKPTDLERGLFLRRIRRNKGKKKRMEDYADENISSTTISNIETCKEPVSEEKVEYYCSKIGINYLELDELIRSEKEAKKKTEEKMKAKLFRIEQLIELTNRNKGMQSLRSIRDCPNYLKHVMSFLAGRGYAQNHQYKLAAEQFRKAIKHLQKNSEYAYSNIHAHSYNQLGKIAYYQNNFEKALEHTNTGLNLFVKDGERQQLWFSLLMNKAVYLERLGYHVEAKEVMKRIDQQRKEIENIEVILNMYDVAGSIDRKLGMYAEAVDKVKSGLMLAQINKKHNRAIELWTTLGSIYIDTNDLEEAEECLNTALDLKSKVKEKHVYLPAYIKLGQIYTRQKKYHHAQEILNDAISEGKNARVISTYIPAFVSLGDCLSAQKCYTRYNHIKAHWN